MSRFFCNHLGGVSYVQGLSSGISIASMQTKGRASCLFNRHPGYDKRGKYAGVTTPHTNFGKEPLWYRVP